MTEDMYKKKLIRAVDATIEAMTQAKYLVHNCSVQDTNLDAAAKFLALARYYNKCLTKAHRVHQ